MAIITILEAIEEIADRHSFLTSQLKFEDFEPFVGGGDEKLRFFHEQRSCGSGARTICFLRFVDFQVEGNGGLFGNKRRPSHRNG